MSTERRDAFLASRRGFSCIKKGMFSDVEGHVLECRKAWAGLERDEKIFTCSGHVRNEGRGEGTVGKAGKNGEDNREQEGGGGRKKLMSMKIIG